MGIHPYCIDQLALGGRYGQYYVARLYFPWAFFLGTHFKLGPCGSPGQQYVSNPPRWGIERTACATWLLGNLKLGYGDSRSCRHRYDNCCTKHRWLPSAIKCCNNALVYYGSTLVVPPVKQSCNLPFLLVRFAIDRCAISIICSHMFSINSNYTVFTTFHLYVGV